MSARNVILQGSGGAAAKPKKPHIDANNLSSNESIEILDLLSEGPIYGWHDADPYKCLFLDLVPVHLDNVDYSVKTKVVTEKVENTYFDPDLNDYVTAISYIDRVVDNTIPPLKDVGVDLLVGQPNQTSLSMVDSARTSFSYSQPLTNSQPFQYDVSNEEVDVVKITIRFNGLVRFTDKGDQYSTTVSFGVYVSSDGSDFVYVNQHNVSGKTTSAYDSSVLVQLTGSTPWIVKLVRWTEDHDPIKHVDSCTVISVQEYVYGKFTYPDSAYARVVINSSQANQNIPTRGYKIDGLLLKIPANYDPRAGTYTGLWNGTWKVDWTDNPAWVMYALLTNTRWGAGIPEKYVDKWGFYDAAQWYDEQVSDGNGGTERRFTFNGVLTTAQGVLELLRAVSGSFCSAIVASSSWISIIVDRPTEPSIMVGSTNVVDGLFTYQTTPKTELVSTHEVIWNDPANHCKADVEIIDDPGLLQLLGRKADRKLALGCTRRTQAQRVGQYRRWTQRLEREGVQYTAGLDHADVVIGQVVEVRDPARYSNSWSGRIVKKDGNVLVLDRAVDVTNNTLIKVITVAADTGTFAGAVTADGFITGAFDATTFSVVNFVEVSGFANKANNGLFRCSKADAAGLGCVGVFTAESASSIRVVQYAILAREVTPSLFSLVPAEIDGTSVEIDGVAVEFSSVVNPDSTGNNAVLIDDADFVGKVRVNDHWMLFASDVEPVLYRIVEKKEVSPGTYGISGILHRLDKWDIIDSKVKYNEIAGATFEVVQSPSNVVLTTYVSGTGYEARTWVRVSWTYSTDYRVKRADVWVRRFYSDDKYDFVPVGSTSENFVDYLVPVGEDGVHEFRVAFITDVGVTSAWSYAHDDIIGISGNPLAPANIDSIISGDQLTLAWSASASAYTVEYVVRWSAAAGANAFYASVIGVTQNTSFSTSARNGVYYVTARSQYGNESAAALEVVVETVTNINVVVTQDEHPAWTGSKINIDVVSDKLRLASNQVVGDWPVLADVGFLASFGLQSIGSYTSNVIDLNGVISYNASLNLNFSLVRLNNKISAWPLLKYLKVMSGVYGNEATVVPQIRASDDGSLWENWKVFTFGTIKSRFVQVKLDFSTTDLAVTPEVSELTVTADMPDRIIAGSNLTCPPGGMRVSFDQAFLSTRPKILVDSQDMHTGDYKTITGIDDTGFNIVFFDSFGAYVSRTFDYAAHGYGIVN